MTGLSTICVLVDDLLQLGAPVEDTLEDILEVPFTRVDANIAVFYLDELQIWKMFNFFENFLHALAAVANVQLLDVVFVGLQVLDDLDELHLRWNMQYSILNVVDFGRHLLGHAIETEGTCAFQR